MANTTAVCASFKSELMLGAHQLGTVTIVSRTSLTAPTTDTIKAALYLATGSYGVGTTAYSVTNEVGNSGSYSAGGITVTNATAPTNDGTTGYWTPSASLQATTFTATAFDACLIYNSTQSNRAIAVYNFGSQTITAGTFTLTMPTNNGSLGLLRIS